MIDPVSRIVVQDNTLGFRRKFASKYDKWCRSESISDYAEVNKSKCHCNSITAIMIPSYTSGLFSSSHFPPSWKIMAGTRFFLDEDS
ncbi:hypothetical protein CEXT_413211 [Caerostris extrusa]|uniref:Ycf15 n=1 Tax=Caerostris extrusa TaxID=172846 RepID=A0AAV4MZQ5_CAEEX|nr:hypothetical protein CEXT_413211 [Caerostris extrusa]